MDEQKFKDNHIDLEYMDYVYDEYPQLYPPFSLPVYREAYDRTSCDTLDRPSYSQPRGDGNETETVVVYRT